MSNNDNYHMSLNDNMLTFRTAYFKAEKGSILHSGIYNRELASSLVAGALILLSGFFFATRFKITVIHLVAALLLFAVFFLIFRAYIFLEPVLSVVIDKKKDVIDIRLESFDKKKISFAITELDNIRLDYFSVSPENTDGIKIVEQVALQHGTVIPGFGEIVEFYTVELELKDKRRIMIFSSGDPLKANDIATKIKNFIER